VVTEQSFEERVERIKRRRMQEILRGNLYAMDERDKDWLIAQLDAHHEDNQAWYEGEIELKAEIKSLNDTIKLKKGLARSREDEIKNLIAQLEQHRAVVVAATNHVFKTSHEDDCDCISSDILRGILSGCDCTCGFDELVAALAVIGHVPANLGRIRAQEDECDHDFQWNAGGQLTAGPWRCRVCGKRVFTDALGAKEKS